MITIHIKSLSGEIQTLEYPQDLEVTIYLVKLRLQKKGFVVHLFKEEDSKEEESEKTYLADDTIMNNNDVLYLFYAREEFTKEEVQKFENKLKERMLFFPEFKEAIIKNKAIVAGGSVLSIFGNYKINDLDIYVNYSNAKELQKDLYILGCIRMNVHRAPAYDESFFRKNNIIARYYTVMDSNVFYRRQNERRYYNNPDVSFIEIDIMVIPDDIPLENVVTNFDLTFCQVWWDGEKIHSYDMEDVRSKSGSLNPDYIESYLNMNIFIVKRLCKYKKRGFTIKIDISSVGENIITKTEKKFDSERWALTKVVNCISETFRNCDNIDLQPEKMTLSSVYEKFNKEIVDAYIINFYTDNVRNYPEKYMSAYREVFLNIIENNNQQDAMVIIREWTVTKNIEIKMYKEYLSELFQDFRKKNQELINKSRLANRRFVNNDE